MIWKIHFKRTFMKIWNKYEILNIIEYIKYYYLKHEIKFWKLEHCLWIKKKKKLTRDAETQKYNLKDSKNHIR